MGFSYAPTAQVRTGVERATLARRTYSLVFLSVLVTIVRQHIRKERARANSSS